MHRKTLSITFVLFLLAVTLYLIACGGGSSSSGSSTSSMGLVTISLSDPPTCKAPNGSFSHVYVTIRDVKVNVSSTADDTSSDWIDLTPDLKNAPKQVDLLGIANNSCLLATLGAQVTLPPGTYRQIRIYLSDSSDASKLTNNQCAGNDVNCVIFTNGSERPLLLSSESRTGIKIPADQIANGGFTIGAGDVKDLVLDFDACASLVMQGNGGVRLKPVMHAGEVKLANALTGKLVDKETNLAIPNATSIVALERRDPNGVSRVVMQLRPDADGFFSLCPVPDGTYDVIAIAVGANGKAYAATVTAGVVPGAALGNIPMIAQTGTATTNATITGQITTMHGTGNTGTATAADLTVFALQQSSDTATTVNFTIPLADQVSPSSTVGLSTAADASCPANTDCATYTVKVPAMWPNFGTYQSGVATAYAQATTTPVTYAVAADAYVPSSGGTANCSPSELTSKTVTPGGGPLSVTAGQTSTATAISFSSCQ